MTDWLKKLYIQKLGEVAERSLLPLWNPKVRWIWAYPNFMNKQMGKQNEQDLPKFLHSQACYIIPMATIGPMEILLPSDFRTGSWWQTICVRPFSSDRCAVICFTISQIPNSRTNPLPSADSPCLSQARPENWYINPYALTVSIFCILLGLCWCFWVLFKCIGTFHSLHFSLSTLVRLVARCGVVRLDWQTQTCRVC